MRLRIKIGKEKYLLWDNEGLAFGEDTPNEDLWNAGYEMRAWGYKYFGRVVAIIASKR